MSDTKVDVCMPTYRPNPKYLKEAIESLLAQTEQHWELWIQDEPADTDTKAILEPYLGDARIHYQQNAERKGIGGNWNASLSHGNAPVVQFLFQDDLWEPACLAEGLRVLQEHPQVGIVSIDHSYKNEDMQEIADFFDTVCSVRRNELNDGLYPGREFLHWWLARDLRPNVVGEPPFVMLRRSTIEEVGPFDEKMHQGLDTEYWLRCLLESDIYFLQKDLGTFRVHSAAATASNTESGLGAMDRIHCIERVIDWADTNALRKHAKESRNRAFYLRVKKQLGREKSDTPKRKVGASSKDVKKYILKHPLLSLKTILRVMAGK